MSYFQATKVVTDMKVGLRPRAPRYPSNFAPSHKTSAEKPVDFTVVDTVQEAAQMPILDPAYQWALLSGLSLGTDNPGPAHIAIDSTLATGSTVFDQSVVVKDRGKGVIAAGGGPVGRNWSYIVYHQGTGKGELSYEEMAGKNSSRLSLRTHRKGLNMAGRLGRIPVSLHTIVRDNGEIVTTGTLGDERYSLRANLVDGKLLATGKVGDKKIHKRYDLSRDKIRDTDVLHFSGRGKTAGLNQTVNVTLQHDPDGKP